METRRGFLKLLGSFVIATTTEQVFGKQQTQKSTPKPKTLPYPSEYNILWRSYFPTLKQNEGEKLNFYRCSSKKVTIGYGCNVEDNPDLLKDVTLYYKGKKITEKGKSVFLTQYKKKTDKELSDYSVSKEEAVSMVKKATYTAIKNLADIFKKDDKSVFFTLPMPMQVLALDVYFNLGRSGFLKYERLKKALLEKNYADAVKESVVYVAKKKTNKERERRKKRLLSITKIIQENPKKPLVKVQELVSKNYQTETPKLIRILSGTKDKICENAIVCGEFERLQSNPNVARSKLQSSKHA